MNRRSVLAAVLVTSVLVACSDDGGTEPSDEPGAPETGDTSTDDTASDETTPAETSTPGTGTPGSGTPQTPGGGVEVSEIDADQLAGAGQETIINDVFFFRGDRAAVGYEQGLQDGRYQPFVLQSAQGDRWQRGNAPMPRGADDAVMSAMVHVGGDVFIVGTQWTDDRANGVVWTQTEDGWEPNEIVGDMADTESQNVRDAAGGQSGLVALGTSDGEETIWTSTDGITWNVPAIEGVPEDVELVDAAANRDGIVVLATAGGRPMVLHSVDGSAFRVLQTGTERQRWNVVTATDKQFVVGGAVYNDGQYGPRLWRIRGDEWPDGPEKPHRERSHYQWGSDAEVTAINHDRGRLLFTVDGVLISSPGRGVWVQLALPEKGEPHDITALVPVPGTESDHAEAVVGGSALYTGGKEEWQESTPDAMTSPYQRIELVGVAHHDGTWVAAGTTTDGLGVTTASIWHSSDGVGWQRTHPLQPADNTSAVTVGTSSNGFVVTGQDPRNSRSVIWTSGNGRTWSRLRSPELRWPKRNGSLHPTSVVPTPEGFAVGGSRQRRGTIEPWLIRVLNDVKPDESPQIHGEVESTVVGVCRPRGNIYMVGAWIEPGTTPAWWSQLGSAPWQRHSLDGSGELRECIANVDDVFAVGTVGQREAVVDISTSQAGIHPLPESDAAISTDLTFIGDNRIAVGGHTIDGASGDGRLWVSDDGDLGSWTVIDAPQLGGPGAQRVAGLARHRNRLLVAVNDGAGARLVDVRLR